MDDAPVQTGAWQLSLWEPRSQSCYASRAEHTYKQSGTILIESMASYESNHLGDDFGLSLRHCSTNLVAFICKLLLHVATE